MTTFQFLIALVLTLPGLLLAVYPKRNMGQFISGLTYISKHLYDITIYIYIFFFSCHYKPE